MNNHDSSSHCEQDQSFQEQCNFECFSSQQPKVALHSMEKFGNTIV